MNKSRPNRQEEQPCRASPASFRTEPEHVVNVPSGTSVMLGAIQNNIKGIEAECGGCCSRATCHVHVDEGQFEAELLRGGAAARRPNSRLSCQIAMSPGLDGLRVTMPERQF